MPGAPGSRVCLVSTANDVRQTCPAAVRKMVLGVKHAAVCASALAGSQMALLISGEHHTQQDKKTTAAPCRVAVSISGDVRSFVDPVVHRSFRRYVVGAIENNGCQVDVFAYAMLEDDVDILLVGVCVCSSCLCCCLCLCLALLLSCWRCCCNLFFFTNRSDLYGVEHLPLPASGPSAHPVTR